jgi:paired amphipathic helix protein Sin3a
LLQFPNSSEATVKWLHKDETTFELDDLDREEQWANYQADYTCVDPTEGVPRDRMKKMIVMRNIKFTLPLLSDNEAEQIRKPLAYDEDLSIRLEVNTLKLMYGKPPSSEHFIYSDAPLGEDPETGKSFSLERLSNIRKVRNDRFKKKFEENNKWMEDQDTDFVKQVKADFDQFWHAGGGPGAGPSAPAVALAPPADGDVEMAGSS